MPAITKLVLHNFKEFGHIELDFDEHLNILVGDNEAGKSSILLALDLVLSASRSKVESIGLETLFNLCAVNTFLHSTKAVTLLPELYVEVYLTAGPDPDLNGKNNSKNIECDGLRMDCKLTEALSKEVAEALDDNHPNFPFEYYAITFSTFSGDQHPSTMLATPTTTSASDALPSTVTKSPSSSRVVPRIIWQPNRFARST